MYKIYCIHLTYHLVLFMCCTLSVGPLLVPRTLKHKSKQKVKSKDLERTDKCTRPGVIIASVHKSTLQFSPRISNQARVMKADSLFGRRWAAGWEEEGMGQVYL